MKRTEITQAMCDHARILLAGGAKASQAAELLGVGESTVYRMKKAGFDAAQYMKDKENRDKENRNQPEVKLVYDASIAEEYRREQAAKAEELPGQIRMELPEKAEERTKDMRFQAAMVDRLIMELDKINDTLNMYLRAMSGI